MCLACLRLVFWPEKKCSVRFFSRVKALSVPPAAACEMPYTCQRCGSKTVRHHCAESLLLTKQTVNPDAFPVTQRSTTAVHDVSELQKNLQRPQTEVRVKDAAASCPSNGLMRTVLGAKQSDVSSMHVCSLCETQAVCEARPGFRMGAETHRVDGDCLCAECWRYCVDELAEYIPCPPRRPPRQVVAQFSRKKRLTHWERVTLRWCEGRVVAARPLHLHRRRK